MDNATYRWWDDSLNLAKPHKWVSVYRQPGKSNDDYETICKREYLTHDGTWNKHKAERFKTYREAMGALYLVVGRVECVNHYTNKKKPNK